MLKQCAGREGRLHIGKRFGRRSGSVSSHKLIAEAWHGLRPTSAHEVAHGNGNPADNRPRNLRWATHLENEADKALHGTLVRGERVGGARLSADDVRTIRSDYASGRFNQAQLAAQFGVKRGTIGDIVRGDRWGHVELAGPPVWGSRAGNSGERNPKARLTADDVRAIRKAVAAGVMYVTLAKQYGVSGPSIRAVALRRSWAHVADE